MRLLNCRDRLQLIGGCALLSTICFSSLSLLTPRFLAKVHAEAIGEDLYHQYLVLKDMHVGQRSKDKQLAEHPQRIWLGVEPPRLTTAQRCPIRPLLEAELEEYNLTNRLRCEPQKPFGIHCGYWLRVAVPYHGNIWLYSDSSRALPYLTLTILSISLIAGGHAGTILFLYLKVHRPIKAMLNALPSVPAQHPQLLPESGASGVHAFGVRINRHLSSLSEIQESRRRLLQGLAHDIGSPVTRISMHIQNLELEPSPQTAAESLSSSLPQIMNDIGRLARLTHQLQNAAGCVESSQNIHAVAVDDLCYRIMDSYRGVQITCKMPRLIANVEPNILERALNNLIDNAISHGSEPILLTGHLSKKELVLKLEDSGPGMASSKASMPPIPEYRNRNLEHQHYGIGLSIVERCCKLHGGRLVLGCSRLGGLQAELHLSQKA